MAFKDVHSAFGGSNAPGPFWANTWWGRRTTIVNVSLVVVVLLFILWTSLAQ